MRPNLRHSPNHVAALQGLIANSFAFVAAASFVN
jgi:hypothetical protein